VKGQSRKTFDIIISTISVSPWVRPWAFVSLIIAAEVQEEGGEGEEE
jgi:hypothetical protein